MRSRKAKLRKVCKAEDKARQRDAYQRWYDWLRTAKRRNVDRETKRLVAQDRTRVDDMLRNIKLPCGSEYEKIEVLAAGIRAAR